MVVTGVGMQSSMGGAFTACAAARAGLTRIRELQDFPVLAEDGTVEPALGHPVLAATGFRGKAKLLCLGWPALEDLLQQEPGFRELSHERTGLLLCLPARELRRPRAREQETPAQVNLAGSTPASDGSTGGRELCARLMELAGLPIPPQNHGDAAWGHAGLAPVVRQAVHALRTGQWSRCLIGAIESLVEPDALEWLHEVRRLKSADKADGLLPGEAAAFLLLERFDEARRRGANILAVVTDAAAAEEPHHYLSGRPSTAGAQLEAVARVLSSDHGPTPAEVWLISDHNGETYRAHEWGCFLVRLAARFPSVRVNASWFPAASFGDTGAASMAIGACMAVRAFRRGYHQAPTALICSASDAGLRGMLRLDQYEAA